MSLYTLDYLDLMKEAHERYEFGVSGAQWAPEIVTMARARDTEDVLDYGCGQALLAANMPFAITSYDPAILKYRTPPQPADIVACTDVLEHVEPECLNDVLNELRWLTIQRGFFVIATAKASKILADGRNAHLIIEDVNWWRRQLISHQFDMLRQITGPKREAIFHVA